MSDRKPLITLQQLYEEQGFIVVAYRDQELLDLDLRYGRPIEGGVEDIPPDSLLMPIGIGTREQFDAQHLRMFGAQRLIDRPHVGFLKMVLE